MVGAAAMATGGQCAGEEQVAGRCLSIKQRGAGKARVSPPTAQTLIWEGPLKGLPRRLNTHTHTRYKHIYIYIFIVINTINEAEVHPFVCMCVCTYGFLWCVAWCVHDDEFLQVVLDGALLSRTARGTQVPQWGSQTRLTKHILTV